MLALAPESVTVSVTVSLGLTEIDVPLAPDELLRLVVRLVEAGVPVTVRGDSANCVSAM